MSFHDSKTVKSKKKHRCVFCGQGIAVNESYIRSTGVYEGDFYSHASHPECEKQFQEDAKKDGDYEIDPYGYPRPEKQPEAITL